MALSRGVKRWSFFLASSLTLASLAVVAGCGHSSSPAAGDADAWLKEVVERYQGAKSYEDAGELHLVVQGEDGHQEESEPMPFSVALERPNLARIHSMHISVVCNGRQLRASIDAITNQVLSLPCPQQLNFENVFPDPMLAREARGNLEVTMPQLALLLDRSPLGALHATGKATKLSDAELDEVLCHRVSVEGPDGPSVFWIRATDGLLRRFEFPTGALKEKFQIAKCSLWADFVGARVDASIAEAAFQFDSPRDVVLVNRLLPPPPQSPSPLLGKKADDFVFLDDKGHAVKRQSLAGKVVVLDLWATWCGWCFRGFPNLQQVYERFKDNDKVTILAVNTDEPTVSDEKVWRSFADNRLSIPIVRDQQQLAGKIFVPPGDSLKLPTMLILGPDGSIQEYHLGYDPNLAQTLPKKIEQLLAGANLARQELDRYAQEKREYEEQLSAATVDEKSADTAEAPQAAARGR